MEAKNVRLVNKYRQLKYEFNELAACHKSKLEMASSWRKEILLRITEFKDAKARKDPENWIIALQYRLIELHWRLKQLQLQRNQLEAKFEVLKKLRIKIKNLRLKVPSDGVLAMPKVNHNAYTIPELPEEVYKSIAQEFYFKLPSPVKKLNSNSNSVQKSFQHRNQKDQNQSLDSRRTHVPTAPVLPFENLPRISLPNTSRGTYVNSELPKNRETFVFENSELSNRQLPNKTNSGLPSRETFVLEKSELPNRGTFIYEKSELPNRGTFVTENKDSSDQRLPRITNSKSSYPQILNQTFEIDNVKLPGQQLPGNLSRRTYAFEYLNHEDDQQNESYGNFEASSWKRLPGHEVLVTNDSADYTLSEDSTDDSDQDIQNLSYNGYRKAIQMESDKIEKLKFEHMILDDACTFHEEEHKRAYIEKLRNNKDPEIQGRYLYTLKSAENMCKLKKKIEKRIKKAIQKKSRAERMAESFTMKALFD